MNSPAQVKEGTLVSIRNLSKHYVRGEQVIPVLSGIDLDIALSDYIALMGPSGSGKSTLLNLIAGIDKPSSGEILVAGVDIAQLKESELAAWRAAHVGFIFQFYNLMPVLTAFDNVELPLLLTTLSRRDRRARVATTLALVGLADRMDHYPNELSGGQQQRVAIAWALISDPDADRCRRAHRRPGPHHRRGDSRPPRSPEPRAGQDHYHGYARSQGSREGAPRRAIGERRAGSLIRTGAAVPLCASAAALRARARDVARKGRRGARNVVVECDVQIECRRHSIAHGGRYHARRRRAFDRCGPRHRRFGNDRRGGGGLDRLRRYGRGIPDCRGGPRGAQLLPAEAMGIRRSGGRIDELAQHQDVAIGRRRKSRTPPIAVVVEQELEKVAALGLSPEADELAHDMGKHLQPGIVHAAQRAVIPFRHFSVELAMVFVR